MHPFFLAASFLLISSSVFADAHCSKTNLWNQSRKWVDIYPVEGRTDVLTIQYGNGIDTQMIDVLFTDLVLPGVDGEYRAAPPSKTEVTFLRAKTGRFELRIRDRKTGTQFRMTGFRCE